MAEMKYHIVKSDKNDKNELLVYWGSERPGSGEVPKDKADALQMALSRRWIPDGWTVVESFDEEEEANKKLKQERSKEKT